MPVGLVAVQEKVVADQLHLEKGLLDAHGFRLVVLLADDEGAVDLDAIAEAARAVSEALDAADVIRGEHVLEVSSPGTDRPLTEPRHFARARGRLVTLMLTDGSEISGRVVAADAGSVELDDGRTVQLATIARNKVEVELNRVADADLDDDGTDDWSDDTNGGV